MWRFSVLVLFVVMISMPAEAKPKKTKQSASSREMIKEQKDFRQHGSFSPAERNLIRAHLFGQEQSIGTQKQKNLPPGLQKKIARGKPLPPGWQKKIGPGESLDYQIYRHGESLPDALLKRLPPAPVGSEILQIENEIIRLNSATRTILDVFSLTPTR